jgi:hypothetical protein
MGEFWAKWPGMNLFFWTDFSKAGSEKGSTRKHTENRVTRWMKLFWGNLGDSRCFTKKNIMGELIFDDFLAFEREST